MSAPDEFIVVATPDPFNPGGSFEIKDPRREYERCEAIHLKKGRSKALHRDGCPHCQKLVDACHDAALMYELLLVLDPDSTAPPVDMITTGFEVVDA